jgi:uncharacterized membrane protein
VNNVVIHVSLVLINGLVLLVLISENSQVNAHVHKDIMKNKVYQPVMLALSDVPNVKEILITVPNVPITD